MQCHRRCVRQAPRQHTQRDGHCVRVLVCRGVRVRRWLWRHHRPTVQEEVGRRFPVVAAAARRAPPRVGSVLSSHILPPAATEEEEEGAGEGGGREETGSFRTRRISDGPSETGVASADACSRDDGERPRPRRSAPSDTSDVTLPIAAPYRYGEAPGGGR